MLFVDVIRVKWHSATLQAFDDIPDWHHEEPLNWPLGFALYSDGSSALLDSKPKAAAAVVLIVYTKEGNRFGGFLCHDLGDDIHAPRAEMAAVNIAVLWVNQLLHHFFPLPHGYLSRFTLTVLLRG